MKEEPVTHESIKPIIISIEDGFEPLGTESVSSLVFMRDGKVYKLTDRNSIKRQSSDLEELREKLGVFSDRVVQSEVVSAEYKGARYTCVIQPFIEGREIKKLGEEELLDALKRNRDFLLALLDYFFSAIDKKEKYPDPVGYPSNPEYKNAINLLLETETGRVLLCDVGLSPHEDTLNRDGESFYEGENVKTYTEKMRIFRDFLMSL